MDILDDMDVGDTAPGQYMGYLSGSDNTNFSISGTFDIGVKLYVLMSQGNPVCLSVQLHSIVQE